MPNKSFFTTKTNLLILVIAVIAVFWVAFEASQAPTDVGPTQCVYKNNVYETGDYICAGKEKDTEARYVWLCKNSKWYYEDTCESAELCIDEDVTTAFCAFSLETLDDSALKSVGGVSGGEVGIPR